jgi:hypothetical protein
MPTKIKSLVTATALSLVLISCTPQSTAIDTAAVKAEITDVLHTQDKAWNNGDIDKFMDDYLKSDDLRFASAGNVNRGWQATLDNYKIRYPDRAAMGVLSFEDLEIKVLSHEYAQVFGRWKLERESDTPGGLFTLLMQNVDGRWIIISDHTSSNGN